MASTYSSRLRLELIGTGEQSGIWGDTTNTNLGTLLDEAIAGVVGITMTDANYTLTSSDGATDQSRKAVLVMSGTLTAARNVVCPTSQKVYIIKNNTTGGFALTLKTSAGTGVSVANGDTIIAYCDGTNVVQASVASVSPSFTGKLSLVGAMLQNSVSVAASNIDCATGNYFSKTISGTTTFTVSNVATTGTATSFVLALTNGGSATINWWSGVKWGSGTAPILTTSGKDVLGFYTTDGGTTWNGFVIVKDVR